MLTTKLVGAALSRDVRSTILRQTRSSFSNLTSKEQKTFKTMTSSTLPSNSLVKNNALRAFSVSCVPRKDDTPPKAAEPFEGFTTVFMFPHIVKVRAMCRLKLYQTGLTFCVVPLYVAMLATGQISPSVLGVVTGLCGVTTLMLFSIGEVFRQEGSRDHLHQRRQRACYHQSFNVVRA